MPGFRSLAQRTKWQQLVAEGKVTAVQFAAREADTSADDLPERAEPRPRTVGPSRAFDAAKIGHTRY